MEGIEGQAFATKNVRDALEPFTNAEAKTGSADFALSEAAAMALLASGSGTLVRLDDHNSTMSPSIRSQSKLVPVDRAMICKPHHGSESRSRRPGRPVLAKTPANDRLF